MQAAMEVLVTEAKSLGVEYDGCRWVGLEDPARRLALGRLALELGLRPGTESEEEGEEGDSLAEPYLLLAEQAERRRLLRRRERLNDRFRHAVVTAGLRPLLRSPEAVEALAIAVAADLPVDEEVLAWVSGPGRFVDADLGVNVHVDPQIIAAAQAAAREAARLRFLWERKQAALAEASFDAEAAAERAGLNREEVAELGDLVSHRYAAIRRAVVDLLRAAGRGQFPAQPDGNRWARLAWLAVAGFSQPPVFRDRRRWEAKKTIEAEARAVGLDPARLRRIVGTARTAR